MTPKLTESTPNSAKNPDAQQMGSPTACNPHACERAADHGRVGMTGPVPGSARVVVRVGGVVGAGQGPPSGGPEGTRSALDARSLPAGDHGLGGPGTGPLTPPPFARPRHAVWTRGAGVRCGRFSHPAERDAYVWAVRGFVKQVVEVRAVG